MLSRLMTLAVLVGLALWLWDFASDERSKEIALVSGPGLLYPGLVVDDVTSLYLQLSFGQDLLLERERGGPWRITEPTQEVARQGLIAQVLENLALAEVKLVPEERRTAELHELGLDPPEHKIRIGIGDSERTLSLGALDEFENMLYARRANDPAVLLVSRNLTSFFGWHGEEWVDPHLLRGLKGTLTGIRIDKPDGVLLDAVQEGGEWRLNGAGAPLADSARISQMVRALQFAETNGVAASRVTHAALREVGLPTPPEAEVGDIGNAIRIEMTAPGQDPAVVFLALPDDQPGSDVYYVARGDFGRILTVPRKAIAMIQNDASFFRERSILPPVRERASALRITDGDTVTLDIVQQSGGWVFRSPERLAGEAVDSHRIEGRSPLGELFFMFDELEAVDFATPKPGEVVTASMHVTWSRAGLERLDRVDLLGEPFENAEGQRLWRARASDRPAERLLLDAEAVEALLDPFIADSLRTLAPVAFDENDYASIKIFLPGRAEPLTSGLDAAGNWTGDDEISRQRALAEDIRRAGLRGFRWEPASHSLTSWPYQLNYLADDGSTTAAISLRPPRADEPQEAFGKPAAYARISGWPDVELIVPGIWLQRFDALGQPIRR